MSAQAKNFIPNTPTWQSELQEAVTDIHELCHILGLTTDIDSKINAALKQFPLRVPRPFLSRIVKNDWNDPLLKQVLPLGIEMLATPGYSTDPLQESACNLAPGLLHKYRSRALLTVTGACAINCRYCFRRHFDYKNNNPGREGWQLALDYIAQHSEINEVILSGGDPLVAPDHVLKDLTQRIAAIEHIKYLRVHTRLPVVNPSRITDSMLDWLCGTRLKPIVVLHCNHAQEIDSHVSAAIDALKQCGVSLFNQTVLLKDVNDNSHTLADLSHALFACNVQPYYLHWLDKVQGAAHFDVTEQAAKACYHALLSQLPGYLVPKLVKETPGMPYKSPVL